MASLLNNPTVRGISFQIVFVLVLGWLVWDIVDNTARNLQKANIAAGFGFLDRTAGFGIIQKLVPYTEASSYGRALYVGLLNTLVVAGMGIVLATLIGFIVGVGRLSSNWLVSRTAATYVEILRNIPLLLQLFFWYFAVLRSLPGMREKWTLLGVFHINIGGLHVPKLVPGEGMGTVVAATAVAIVAMIGVAKWGHARQNSTGRRPPVGMINTALLLGLPLAAFLIAGRPLHIELPVFNETGPLLRRGFQQNAGMTIIPEFVGLLLALSLYTSSYIAEVVRGGVQAVNRGQTEAALSLGLRPRQTLRLVVLPQAMRIIIPPLTNQYLNLTKNSSLAVAIAYPDLVSIGGTVLNQTGQAVEVVSIWMLFYLGLSFLTSAVMGYFNKRVALVER